MFLQCGIYSAFFLLNSHIFSKMYISLKYFIELNLFLNMELRTRYMLNIYAKQEQGYTSTILSVLIGERAHSRCDPQLQWEHPKYFLGNSASIASIVQYRCFSLHTAHDKHKGLLTRLDCGLKEILSRMKSCGSTPISSKARTQCQ